MRPLLLSLLATALVSASAPSVVAKIKVSPAAAPCATTAGGGFVWVSEYGRPYLLRIDPKTNTVVGRTMIGTGSCGLGYGAGSLWIEDTNSNTISRVSARTHKRLKAIPVGIAPYDATFAFGSAWTTPHVDALLERIDPARNKVVARWPVPGAIGVVAAFGSVWATGQDGVVRIDPSSGKMAASIPVAGGAGWTAASSDAVWVTSTAGLVRIDPQTNAVAATVTLPSGNLGDPDVVGGKVWVPVITRNLVAIVDPASNTVASTVKAGVGPFVVTNVNGQAWVPSWKGSDIWRFRP
jgi:DNA-binding beta-propeller fold protein YncE